MSAFDAGMDVFFLDPHLGVDAIYRQGGTAALMTVRGIRRRPDESPVYGEMRLKAAGEMLDLRMSEVPAPADGDTLALAGITYRIQGAPEMDEHRLTWRCQLVPVQI